MLRIGGQGIVRMLKFYTIVLHYVLEQLESKPEPQPKPKLEPEPELDLNLNLNLTTAQPEPEHSRIRERGLSPLFFAVLAGKIEVVRALIRDHGASVKCELRRSDMTNPAVLALGFEPGK
jgi:hypothetical protein